MDKKIQNIIEKLLHYSKTKLINSIAFLAALNLTLKNKNIFTRKELENEYKLTVKGIEQVTKSNLNIGGRFHADTYPDRMSQKYGAFKILTKDKIQLPPFIINLSKNN